MTSIFDLKISSFWLRTVLKLNIISSVPIYISDMLGHHVTIIRTVPIFYGGQTS